MASRGHHPLVGPTTISIGFLIWVGGIGYPVSRATWPRKQQSQSDGNCSWSSGRLCFKRSKRTVSVSLKLSVSTQYALRYCIHIFGRCKICHSHGAL